MAILPKENARPNRIDLIPSPYRAIRKMAVRSVDGVFVLAGACCQADSSDNPAPTATANSDQSPESESVLMSIIANYTFARRRHADDICRCVSAAPVVHSVLLPCYAMVSSFDLWVETKWYLLLLHFA